MEKIILKEEESEVFVIQGIEEEEITFENEIKEEMEFKGEEFWPEKKVNCDGNSSCSLSEEKFEISKEIDDIDPRRMKISNTDPMNAANVNSGHENVTLTGGGNFVNIKNDCHVNSKVNPCNFKKRAIDEGDNIQESCSGKAKVSNRGKSIPKKLKPFRCNICGCCFDLIDQLGCHVDVMHGNKKPYMCTKCHKSYSSNQGLSFHIRHVHNIKTSHLRAQNVTAPSE